MSKYVFMFSTRQKEAKDVTSQVCLCFGLWNVRGKFRFALLPQKVTWRSCIHANGKSSLALGRASDFCGLTKLLLPKKKKKKVNSASLGKERGDAPLEPQGAPLLTPGCSRLGASLWKEPCVCDSVVCSLVLCDHVWQVCGEKKKKQQHLEEKNEIRRILRDAEKESLYIGKQHCW